MSEALDFDLVAQQAAQAARELLEAANPAPGDFFVVGCSSSEIVGGHIGKDSSLDAAAAVYAGIAPVVKQHGLWLAAQCCEHLNRALIVEKAALPPFTPVVNVLPQPHAGGSWATTCWKKFREPAGPSCCAGAAAPNTSAANGPITSRSCAERRRFYG